MSEKKEVAPKLSDAEQAGVDYFVNFLKKVNHRRAKDALEKLDQIPADLDPFKKFASLIATEDVRFLPVIATSFADDLLGAMFRRELPDSVPGGRSELLSGFGPLSRLAQRIQIAYAFRWMSADVLLEINKLRSIRNDISHKWDLSTVRKKLEDLVTSKMTASEKILDEILAEGVDGQGLSAGFSERLDLESRFRIRLLWIVGQVLFQSRYWPALVKIGLDPNQVMFGHDDEGGFVKSGEPKRVLGEVGRQFIQIARGLKRKPE
jgi:hypothetical protein